MFYNFLLLSTFVYQLISLNTPCSVMNESQQYIHFYNSESQLIIQSNDENFENITNIGYELINESFRLSFSQDITIIWILKCDNNFKIKKVEQYVILKRVCILVKLNQTINSSNIYMIGCTFINFQEQNKYFDFDFNKIEEKIEIELEGNEICQNIFQINQQKLILFCLDDSQLKFIEIDTEFKISKIITHQKQRNCQMKILEFSKYLMLSFIRCEEWIVYAINENLEIKVQLDEKFQNQQNLFQITTNLINMQVCQKKIYYIFQNGYIHQQRISSKDQIDFASNQMLNINDDENLEYLVFQRCNFFYSIVSIKDQIYVKYSNQKYYLGTSQIKLSQQNGLLVIISEEQLTLLVSKNIKYIYIFNKTTTNQVKLQITESQKTQKIFYEIINSEKQIRFLQFEFKSHIHNDYSYDFFYVITNSNILKNIQCQKINIVSDQEYFYNDRKYKIFFKLYNHSVQQHFQFIKYDSVFESQYDIARQSQLVYDQKLNITVYDTFDIKEQCQSKYLYEKNNELLYYQYLSIILIKKQQNIFWTTCNDDQLLNQINIGNEMVLAINGFIILIGIKVQDIRVVDSRGIYFPFKTMNINNVLDKIDIFSQYLLIYMKQIDIPLILNLNFFLQHQYIEMEFYINQKIKFYHDDAGIMLIQYQDQFIIKKEFDVQIGYLTDITLFVIQNDFNAHLAFGVHDQQEIIKLYFISDFELIEIDNYFIDEYVLIRPIKYQIYKNNIMLLMKENKYYHILIFSYILKNLQLIKDIKSTRQQFFVSQDYLIYYNSEDFLEIFDVRNFHIDLKFINQNDKVYFFNSIKFKFNIQSKNILVDVAQHEIDISIIFLQPPIKTLNEFLNINYEQFFNNRNKSIIKIPFNPHEYFEGQINDLDFQSQSNDIQIKGPLINDFFVAFCKFGKQIICKQSRDLIIQNRQVQLSEILKNNITINVFSNTINESVFKLFDDYYLIILEELNQQLGLIIQYNQTSKNYIKTQELYLYNLTNNSKSTIEVRNKQSIHLIVQGYQLKTMLYFNGTKFIQILLPENILDVCFLDGSKDNYVFLYYSLNLTLEFQVQSITQSEILFSKEIYQTQIIQDQIFFSNQELNQFIKFYKLISCSQQDHVLSIMFIQFTTYYTQIIKLTINVQSLESNLFFEKKLRIIADKQMINYLLLDCNFFGINVDDSVSYYNLSKNQEFYDSQFLIRSQIKNIYQYNSTHYYCIIKDLQYIGRIGFELWFTLNNETYMTNKLIAINDVSKASIDISLTIIQNQSIDNNNSLKFQITLVLICLIIIIIFLFILRRNKLLRKFLKTKIST